MEWKDWIGKKVFVKLSDGQIYSNSKVLEFEEPFMSLEDKFKLPVIINVNNIIKINEEVKDDKKSEGID